MTAHKSHDARITMISRKSDKCKTSDHVAINNVVISTTGGICTLARDDLVVITLEWIARFTTFQIIFRIGNQWAEWAEFFIVPGLPE